MHANTGDFWNRNNFHKKLGYDKFYSKQDYNIDEVIGLGLSDKSFFKQSVEKLKKEKEENGKFMATMIMLSNHTPFDDLDKYGEFDVDIKEQVTKTNENGEEVTEDVSYPYMEGTKLGNYFKSVHYADSALGELVNELDEAGLLENTILVIYGDHDAKLPKKDYVSQLPLGNTTILSSKFIISCPNAYVGLTPNILASVGIASYIPIAVFIVLLNFLSFVHIINGTDLSSSYL